jgi:hypothetical protein
VIYGQTKGITETFSFLDDVVLADYVHQDTVGRNGCSVLISHIKVGGVRALWTDNIYSPGHGEEDSGGVSEVSCTLQGWPLPFQVAVLMQPHSKGLTKDTILMVVHKYGEGSLPQIPCLQGNRAFLYGSAIA